MCGASSGKQAQKIPSASLRCKVVPGAVSEPGFQWEGGLSCTSECASGESAQGKCRAQKVGLAAGCHFSADQVCVEIFVCLLKKQTKQQKQIQEHLLVYKYTWVWFFF